MTSKYLSKEKPPICLHILGQGLVESVWREGKEIREAALEVLAHHIVRDLYGKSDTLDPRLERLRKAVIG